VDEERLKTWEILFQRALVLMDDARAVGIPVDRRDVVLSPIEKLPEHVNAAAVCREDVYVLAAEATVPPFTTSRMSVCARGPPEGGQCTKKGKMAIMGQLG
jgi:hypothetical protein